MKDLLGKHYRRIVGFSLLELMVVVAILGVLATVAVPRFNIFRARARQSEAKSNLGVIFTLQEAFAIDHEHYYDGNSANWGGTPMNLSTVRDGYLGASSSVCKTNKLGFRLANCDKARYGYFIAGADETEFLAIAYAASDVASEKRVFPSCDGSGALVNVTIAFASATGIQMKCSINKDSGDTSFSSGDAWCLDEARNIFNYRDIVEYCDN